jgi:hypothetical protein
MKFFPTLLLAGLLTQSVVFSQALTAPQLMALSSPPRFAWTGAAGHTYFIQCSRDLKTWDFLPEIRSGAGTTFEIGLLCQGVTKVFARLLYTNAAVPAGSTMETADFDGDGVSNIDEIALNSNPLANPMATDADGDGIPDGY